MSNILACCKKNSIWILYHVELYAIKLGRSSDVFLIRDFIYRFSFFLIYQEFSENTVLNWKGSERPWIDSFLNT